MAFILVFFCLNCLASFVRKTYIYYSILYVMILEKEWGYVCMIVEINFLKQSQPQSADKTKRHSTTAMHINCRWQFQIENVSACQYKWMEQKTARTQNAACQRQTAKQSSVKKMCTNGDVKGMGFGDTLDCDRRPLPLEVFKELIWGIREFSTLFRIYESLWSV